jgi:hypothetical protein
MFTGNEEQTITLAEATALTQAYRNANPGAVLGEYFGKEILTDILNQPNCVGVRMYYGLSANGQPQPVIAGVYANGNDIVEGTLGDRSVKSPPYSGVNNALNS